jgi:hypothetical protein
MTLILHIGAPKTATSTLQNAFFPRHPGLLFLGKQVDGSRKGWRNAEIEALMLGLERSNLDFRPDRAAVARMVEEIAAAAGGRPVVISSEDLCLFSGIDSFGKIARIRDLFAPLGAPRLVLAVRNQVALLKSIYLTEHRGEMLHLTGTAQAWCPSFDQYLDIHFRYAWAAVLESFRFAAMIERHENTVGRDNIFVYAFDDFVRNPVNTLAALCRFIGVDDADPCLAHTAATHQNPHQSARVYATQQLRTFVAKRLKIGAVLPAAVKDRARRWLNRGPRFDITPSPEAGARITSYYAADNAALFAQRGIRL